MGGIPLTFLNIGEKGIVEIIEGSDTITKRLYEMGINKGSNIEIIKNDFGPLIVSLTGSRIAISKGLAQKILINKR
ncbi:FeoA family protein [Clostridium tetani]|uniref:FeoA family protein n=1 Tax=Clostridium tetani TaxID=1513 RepID=UPI00100C2808|nr:FeoA domain-containing protein [Clostridium tetani]RXM58573.1 ferrous iron transport protein A [Clostridium tetani]RXM79361.1 ferrous iron transport protein A [Clostridium tetani]RYV00173.1 ferrous iron transport protein A [Clostridium tetani]